MTVGKQVSKGVAWLSVFKFISQTLSWVTTILIARILTSSDYGLMEMATVFTGYIDFFVEFGISSAIVHRKEISKQLQSSIFWFLVVWGVLLATSTLCIGPITAWYFNNPLLAPLTSTVGILFIISALAILPRSLLHRELAFKKIGAIDVASVLSACVGMYILALNGAGVWTLLGGTILKESIRVILLYVIVRPAISLHFSFREIRPIIGFGLPIVISNTIFYLYTKADRFFGGRALGELQLGFYAVALQLAAMPVEKILSLFQSALFPGLSALQNDHEKYKTVFLNAMRAIYSIIFPLFVGGFVLADNIILTVLGPKWAPAIPSFKLLLIGQIFISICSPLHIAHTSRGNPKIPFYAHLILSPMLIISFYVCAQYQEQHLLAIPWISVYPTFTIGYLFYTLKKLDIKITTYMKTISHAIGGTLIMALGITITLPLCNSLSHLQQTILLIFLGSIIYMGYIVCFQRTLIRELYALLKEK